MDDRHVPVRDNVVPLFSTPAAARLPIRERSVRALVDLRRECGLSAPDFASAVNAALGYGAVTAELVGGWERGVAVPPIDIFVAMLTTAPDVRRRVVDDLMGEVGR